MDVMREQINGSGAVHMEREARALLTYSTRDKVGLNRQNVAVLPLF
jgi:hypothetical protein